MNHQTEEKTRKIKQEHWQSTSILLILYDIVVVNVSYFFALWLRFDGVFSAIPKHYFEAWLHFAPIYTVVCVVVFLLLRLYRSLWRFASISELWRVVLSSLITCAVHILGITLLFRRMPISYYVLGMVVQFILVLGIRFSYRLILTIRRSYGKGDSKHVMIVGAGNAGQMILRDISHSHDIGEQVSCFIDDNPNKWNRYIDGVPIVGGREDIPANVKKYDIKKIYIAIPSATAAQKRGILDICKDTGCELKSLPSVAQLLTGKVNVNTMQDVSVEDLLGREPIRAELDEVFRFLNGKRVLVTGGGGSIGSELCRQIAAHDPEKLIIFDIYENSTYDIELELKERYPDLDIEAQIGSVRDSRKLYQLFDTFRPQIVYHAAAHKHVPLMEDAPCEAIKNNAIGTYKTAYAAMLHGCERFVLISTDKAVNPTNIMGASKRLCEMIIQSFDAKIKAGKVEEIPQLFTHEGEEYADKIGDGAVFRDIKTEFVAVRFGNVLGSNGSVIPIFKKQIAKGGPVTVTHPDIIRYFMTIPEAVSLVLLAGTYAHGGEIFVLDMGEPVKIDTLARNLIKLSGLKPDEDIPIVYTGLRPGEKLYEEKLMAEEGLRKTDNEMIHIGEPIAFDCDKFLVDLGELMKAAYANRRDIKELTMKIVTTYKPA